MTNKMPLVTNNNNEREGTKIEKKITAIIPVIKPTRIERGDVTD